MKFWEAQITPKRIKSRIIRRFSQSTTIRNYKSLYLNTTNDLINIRVKCRMRNSKRLAKELSSRSQSFHPTPGRYRRRIVANCIPFETFFYSRFVLSYMRARTHARTHAFTHAGTRGLDSSVLLLTQHPIKAAKWVRLPPCVLPSGRARITSIVAKTIAIAGALTSRASACSNHLGLVTVLNYPLSWVRDCSLCDASTQKIFGDPIKSAGIHSSFLFQDCLKDP